MKIKFYDPFKNENLRYQEEAIKSITDIFKGQEINERLFTLKSQDILGTVQCEKGIANNLVLREDELLKNVKEIQKRNGLDIAKEINKNNLNFSVEMETGTGKTYVFLRTIFELNRLYGFKKFVIVVPSIAIKEGIKKSLDITKEHFSMLYDNVNYNYFIYNSNKLNQINEFARSNDIEIMIINIDAFNKDINKINQPQEKTLGEKPIDLIASTKPIVIIDEPQSVDSTEKAKNAIKSLNPLCILRYSATHKEKYNLMYKLDAVDAYEKKLVKQIEVASVKLSDTSNLPYIKLKSVDNKNGIKAKIEVEVFKNNKLQKVVKTVKGNSDLYEITNRDIYNGFVVREIYAEKGNEYIEFLNGEILTFNNPIGEIDKKNFQRIQIRKTIEEHLDKEKDLLKKGIKVLSLFFIDRVANYREYDEEGNPKKGKFALMFEEEFLNLIDKPKYKELKEKIYNNLSIDEIHDGYFSQDKKGKFKDTTGKTKADESTYEKIMKNKEKLLSLDEPLRFIFSHSALREGWDNPNVFQICTLNETKSTIKKRQEIGRGLRLCVNDKGERVYGVDINRLTVIANESYEEFAKKLQKEYEEIGIKFGVIEKHIFSSIVGEESEELFEFLVQNKYVDKKGKISEKLKSEIENLPLPEKFLDKKDEIIKIIKKSIGRKIEIKNVDERKRIKLKKEVILSEDFQNLWNKIKHKTLYKIDFDENKLIENIVKRIDEEVVVGRIRYEYEKAVIDIKRSEIDTKNEDKRPEYLINTDFNLPDIVSFLQEETRLKRKDIIKILTNTKKLAHFKVNPNRFIEEVLRIIKEEMNKVIIDGVKYEKLNEEYTIQEVFDKEEIIAYMKNLKETQKSVADFVICDSDVEKKFVEEFNKNENIKLFAKLPQNFKINTPVGSYNPDFALIVEIDGNEKLYFVLESKGSLIEEDRRGKENYKIICAKRHFDSLKEKNLEYVVEKDFKGFKKYIY